MTIDERVELYKSLFPECKALSPMRSVIIAKGYREAAPLQQLELIRELNTELTAAYQITIPVITFFVRDNSYVPATSEIYLGRLGVEGFLHQYRHHLQNEARKYQRRLLLVEDRKDIDLNIIYSRKECVYQMDLEDDAEAWARFIIESV